MRVAANQPPPLVGHDVVTSDAALVEAVTRHASAEVVDDLDRARARRPARPRPASTAMLANTHEPELTTYDRFGNRIDEVALPPVVALADDAGRRARAAGGPVGVRATRPHAHVRRAAGFLAWSQTEPGHGCPISMTYAAVPALRVDDDDRQGVDAGAGGDDVRPRDPAGRREGRRAGRHGHDREAGRLRRPGQRDRGPADRGRRRVHAARPQVVHLRADERRLPRAGAGARAGCRASWCPARCPTAAATGSTSSGSRTSSATGPTPRRRSSSTARWRDGSATRAAGSARSSRWWPRPGSTACSGRPP